MSAAELHKLTGYKSPAGQTRWFRHQFGEVVPADRFGPIITHLAFEALLAKRLGLANTINDGKERPTVRLFRSAGSSDGRAA